ncbi:hypothetical protein [Paenibacillus arenilitoris]|uniref:Uncharacterized protein n=1 Tax=Paenibacillus arenilitoris TaxID=2772299 RepID=A0A927CNN6_9BACL|nr:hypothetical protein [Paenibacillus arenilitoris]MBD2870894.1 hypothetical protein [Paenibacillus arenilitoris]
MENLLWSIALPGFGQILNRKYVKGLFFILLEFVVNVKSNFNEVILLSFHGDIQSAIEKTDYQWLLFYPCLYLFAAWDAYRDSGAGEGKRFSYLPFITAAYCVTVGLIYSTKVKVFGVLLGPVWLPMLGCLVGVLAGLCLRRVLLMMGQR